MITINHETCIGCMRCVDACPFFVLRPADGKPDPGEGKLCIKCLHCAAVCPQDAITLGELEGALPESLPILPEDHLQQIRGQLMSRRSYRRFSSKPVSEDILKEALTVAAWAPSAKNQHPAKWIIINQEKTITAIMDLILANVRETGQYMEIDQLYRLGHNPVLGNAGTLIIGYARTDAVNPPVDTALALYNAELFLQAQRIGTCWAGYLTRMCNQIPALRDMLGIPEGTQVYGALMVGYPEGEEYLHIPNRHKRPEIQWR